MLPIPTTQEQCLKSAEVCSMVGVRAASHQSINTVARRANEYIVIMPAS